MPTESANSSAPTEQQVHEYFKTLSNWGRWGEEDEAGTLNYITPEKHAAAARLVTEGVAVSCSLDLGTSQQPDQILGAPQRLMLVTGESAHPEDPPAMAAWGPMEYFGLAFHGFTVTHVDSLCHCVWEDKMYNDRPANMVTARSGGLANSVLAARNGITTRGVILDIAGLKGKDWLDPGEGVFPEDLDAAEKRQGITVESGDAVFLRTGYGRRRRELGAEDMLSTGQSGWHVASLPWLHEREVAIIGSDTSQEVVPSGYTNPVLPVHSVGIVAMGLWLVDNLDLEDATAKCLEFDRWEFHLAMHPLLIEGGTGSPVNPIASF
ncbi:MAG TPA: cyclase family protein [Microthrixaceae bacterium]|nr:cyclase family protein [Microthrixaceae bacterium]